MATTSVKVAFVPQFEACPVQQRRRSSTAGTIGSGSDPPGETEGTTIPKNSSSTRDRSSSSTNDDKKKKSKRTSTTDNKIKIKACQSSDARDIMHSLSQSQATDLTAEIDNSAKGRNLSTDEDTPRPNHSSSRGQKKTKSKSEEGVEPKASLDKASKTPRTQGTDDDGSPQRTKKDSHMKKKKVQITDEKEIMQSSGSVATETTEEMPSTSTMSRDREADDVFVVAAPTVTKAKVRHGSSSRGDRRGHQSKGKDSSRSRHRSKGTDDKKVNVKVEAFNNQSSPASVAMASREMEYDDIIALEQSNRDETTTSESRKSGKDETISQDFVDQAGIMTNSNYNMQQDNMISRGQVGQAESVTDSELTTQQHVYRDGTFTTSSGYGDKVEKGALSDSLRGSDDGLAEKNLTSHPLEEPDKYIAIDLPPENHHEEEKDNRITVAAHGRVAIPDVEYGRSNGGYLMHGDIEVFNDEDLAIAVAVDDTMSFGDDVFYHAIEYDPDAKPPFRKNRRFRFYIIIITSCVVLAICTVGIVYFAMTLNSSGGFSQTESPTNPPTTASQGVYRDQFLSLVGEGVNQDGSPYDLAANWIIYEDRLRLAPTDELLIQRYILALFYFATTANEDRLWKSCNRPQHSEGNNCDFQRFVRDQYTDEISYKSESAIRWLSDTSECDWIGVVCDDVGSVVGLELKGQDIAGPIPGELSIIPFLQKISLAYNMFTGTIPETLPQLRYLLDLELNGNSLTGTIPDGLYEILTLQNLNLGENLLTGTLSTEVGRLTNLKGLHYFENQLEGTIPTEIGKLQYLSYTRGHTNALTGSIPTEIGRLTFLKELWMQENLLSSTIPTEVGRLSVIRDFRIFSNRISGTIPNELFDNLSQLTRLDLQDMRLTGTLSTRIGEMRLLESLRVRKNRLTGTVPTELASIPTLRLIWVHLNEFTGSIPEQICAVSGKGRLDYITADCGPQGAPSQECACCESCCDRSTEICLLVES